MSTATLADQAWHVLTHDNGQPTLDEKKIKAFPVLYEAALKEFEPRYLQLVMAHVGWLTSVQLANWMEGVHDDADIRSGYAYSESVSQCIGHAVCTQPCIDQLTRWLSDGNLKSPRNLYGRALLYNQADIIAAAEPQLKGSDIQVENILNIYKGAIDRLHDPKQATQLIDHLALTTGNVISRSLAEGGQNVARSLAMLHLKLLAGGSLKVSNASAADVARWAITQAQEQGIKLDTNRRQTRADARAEARSAVKQAKGNQRVIAYELDIPRLEKEGRIAPGTIKGMGIPGIAMAQKWLGSSSPRDFRLGVVTIIVQMMALNFAMKDLANNDQFNQTETRFKATIAIASLSAAIVETAAVSVEKSVEHPLGAFIRNQWGVDAKLARAVAKMARRVGAIAGVIAGIYDIWFNARDAARTGNSLLSQLYAINGFLGIAFPIAIYFSAGALFWPLLIFSFGIGIAIAFVNASALKNWISRCEFSIGERYTSFDEQVDAYRKAVGA